MEFHPSVFLWDCDPNNRYLKIRASINNDIPVADAIAALVDVVQQVDSEKYC